MNPEFKKYLLELTGASNCDEVEVIQSLWSGYGSITRIELEDSPFRSLVVKNISLEMVVDHPRGWNTDKSHQRKVRSYEVESNWYAKWSAKCNSSCKVPECYGSLLSGTDRWIVLEDLDIKYPVRKEDIKLKEIKNVIKWLANFHGTFMSVDPVGLWEIGTYWHLATRQDELQKLRDPELKAKAPLIDEKLNGCSYKTIIHGDAKLANFCFSRDGSQVAAVDFQYVGGGCGMKDIAYFLGSCLDSNELGRFEQELLNFYFQELALALRNSNVEFEEVEQEWRAMYPFACADFTRFLLGWMPEHQKVNGYQLKKLRMVIASL